MLPLAVECEVSKIKDVYSKAIVFEINDIGDSDLFLVIARPMTMSEVEQSSQVMARDESVGLEWVFNKCYVASYSYATETLSSTSSSLPLGVASVLYSKVLEQCALTDVEELASELLFFREQQSSVFYGGAAFIMKAFAGTSLQNIKDFTRSQFAEHIILAELINGSPFELVPAEDTEVPQGKDHRMLDKIKSEAKVNSRHLDFGEENSRLAEVT